MKSRTLQRRFHVLQPRPNTANKYFLKNKVKSKTVYNVKDFGAKGDSLTIDSPAINLAITAASENGGGTVYIPKGIYSCYSIRLASNIKIELEEGAVLKAAQYTDEMGFDLA